MRKIVAVIVTLIFIAVIVAADEDSKEVRLQKDEDNDELIETWDGDLNAFENDDSSSKWGSSTERGIKLQEKKIKIKKKDKKMLLEILTAGLLIKSAFLPLAIGFLKLLTGKALMITMMALTLILAITFRSATDKKSHTTEVINLVGHGHKHRSLDIAPEIVPVLDGDFIRKYKI